MSMRAPRAVTSLRVAGPAPASGHVSSRRTPHPRAGDPPHTILG
ncbi:hypothetical protein A33M_0598 [Rhodovulum sp. PH10]|nr:hypothetical protein A33M_0598 [Rhodovulum sp. PH10]